MIRAHSDAKLKNKNILVDYMSQNYPRVAAYACSEEVKGKITLYKEMRGYPERSVQEILGQGKSDVCLFYQRECDKSAKTVKDFLQNHSI